MANIFLNWDDEFNPYQDFAALPAGNRLANVWVVPNRTGDTNGMGSVPTLTVFNGDDLTYDPTTGVPNGGTITSVSLLVLDYTQTMPGAPVFQVLTNISGISIDAEEFSGYILGVKDVRAAVEAATYNSATWLSVIDQEGAVVEAETDDTHITLLNTDGTFTVLAGEDLVIGTGGVTGQVSGITQYDVDGTTVLNTIDLESLLDLDPGDTVDAAAIVAALFEDDASSFFFRLFNEGDGTTISVINGFQNGIGDSFFTSILDGPGSDTIIDQSGLTGVSYAYADRIDAFLGDTTGVVSSNGGNDSDSLINVHRLLGSEGDDVIHANGRTLAVELFGNDGNDTIVGGAGNDFIEGGLGDDSLDGGAGRDRVSYIFAESAVHVSLAVSGAQDTLEGGLDTLFNFEELEGSNHNDTLIGDDGDNELWGLDGNDTIIGAAGNDLINGEDGQDTMGGGLGNDTYYVSQNDDIIAELANEGSDEVFVQFGVTSYTLGANVENLSLFEHSAADYFAVDGIGNALNNIIRGNAGVNAMSGGAGDDIYYVQTVGDTAVEGASAGLDKVFSTITFTLGANVEALELQGAAAINGTGAGGNETLLGNTGTNTLSGLAGNDFLFGGVDGVADTLIGGTGNDIYFVIGANDAVQESASEGTDTVRSALATYTLGANVERLELQGTGNFNGIGNSAANSITGNSGANSLSGMDGDDVLSGLAGADQLDGGLGKDTMTGGAGDDLYIVDNAGDLTIEVVGGGNDTVESSVTRTLGSQLENLTLTGASVIDGTGNAIANTLNGATNSAVNTLRGLGGADTYIVGAGDIVDETAANSGGVDNVRTALSSYTLTTNVENLTFIGAGAFAGTGNALANAITGGASADTLNGGGGADTLTGLGGSDTYVVDHLSDVVVEAASSGADTVQASVSFTLAANVENLTLTGAGVIDGTGNTLANTIDGASNSAANTLQGLAGADTYIVGAGDIVDETAGGSSGVDIVRTALAAYTLTTNVENLTFTGTGAFTGTGNALNNVMAGGASADTLNGGTGADTMTGLGGSDIYVVDNVGDIVVEAASGGADTIQTSLTSYSLNVAGLANVENLTYTGAAAFNGTGNALANVITGGSAANTLSGLAGADTLNGFGGDDVLNGGEGNDTLTGGLGSDTFLFNTAPNATTNKDTITDFNVAADTIQLENAVFTALVGTGVLTAAQFRVGAAALDADDRIIYNAATGALIYDSNGNVAGGAIQFATLTSGLALTNADFVII